MLRKSVSSCASEAQTEVPQPFEGRGLAERMTRTALDFARSENLQVEPRCSYTAYFMQKHPEYDDLLAAR